MLPISHAEKFDQADKTTYGFCIMQFVGTV